MPVDSAVVKVEARKEGSTSKVVLVILFVVLAFLSYRYFSSQKETSTVIYGVKVVSDVPIADSIVKIQSIGVALLKTELKGGITCNLELLSSLVENQRGYPVSIQEGEQGVYLYENAAYLKGMGERELITACNAFNCIANNITCPSDISLLGRFLSSSDEVNLVLDSTGGQNAGREYAEIMGALAFIQVEKIDVNKDGIPSQYEITNLSGNFLAIRPYVMYNQTCKPQQLHNLVETYEPLENESVDCGRLMNSIFVLNSTENKIVLDQSNIFLFGNNDHIYDEAVILRDALSPRWIRVLYRVDS